MTRIYYVESKIYWKDLQGTDYQLADGGDMPTICTSKKRAIEVAKIMEQTYIDRFGYKTTIPDSGYPCKKTNCLYAVRQENEQQKMRRELKVYLTYTC